MRSKLLRGNWFEENSLEKYTGCRYHPDPRDKIKSSLLTNARTILMDERVEPKDYTASQLQVNPRTHKDYVPHDAHIGIDFSFFIIRFLSSILTEIISTFLMILRTQTTTEGNLMEGRVRKGVSRKSNSRVHAR